MIIGEVNCSSKKGNVGRPACAVKLDHLVGLVLTFDGFEIPNAKLGSFADMLEYLQEATLASGKDRVFYIPKIFGNEDTTPDPEVKQSGYGFTVKIDEKPHQFNIELEDLGIKFYQNLRKFKDRKDMRMYWIDTTFIGGQQTSTGLKGFECTFMPKQVKVGIKGGDYTMYKAELQLEDTMALSDKLSTVLFPENFDLSVEMGGILDVELTATGGLGIATVKAKTWISRTPLYNLYADALAVAGAWVVRDASTNAIVTPTGVAKDTVNEGWAISLSAGTYNITLASPSALEALNVGSLTSGGYESNIVTATVTA